MLQVISLLVENKPGALLRVTGVLSARGYNIESLTVARTMDPELSRMTIVVDVEPTLRQQVIKQMNRLVNVLQATDLTECPSVMRDLVLVRVQPETIDDRNLDAMRAEVTAAASASPRLPVAVEMSRVKFMPSLSLAGLIQLSQSFKGRKQRLVFVGLHSEVRQTLVLMRLDRLFEIHDDLSSI